MLDIKTSELAIRNRETISRGQSIYQFLNYSCINNILPCVLERNIKLIPSCRQAGQLTHLELATLFETIRALLIKQEIIIYSASLLATDPVAIAIYRKAHQKILELYALVLRIQDDPNIFISLKLKNQEQITWKVQIKPTELLISKNEAAIIRADQVKTLSILVNKNHNMFFSLEQAKRFLSSISLVFGQRILISETSQELSFSYPAESCSKIPTRDITAENFQLLLEKAETIGKDIDAFEETIHNLKPATLEAVKPENFTATQQRMIDLGYIKLITPKNV